MRLKLLADQYHSLGYINMLETIVMTDTLGFYSSANGSTTLYCSSNKLSSNFYPEPYYPK